MSTFKPYSVQAKLNRMSVLCIGCTRRYVWRLGTFEPPGLKGDMKNHNGRKSIVDSVTLLVTVPEVAQIETMANSPKPIMWTNPLLRSVEGHLENLDIPMDLQLYGYFRATFSFVEAVDPPSSATPTANISANSSQATNNAIWNDLATDMDGLDDIPGQAGTDTSSAYGAMGDAFTEMDSVFGDIIDEDGTWKDLSRSLDVFSAAADTFVDAVQTAEEWVGSASDAITSAPLLIIETTREAIDSLKEPGLAAASFITQAPSDLFSMMADAGIDITEAAIATLMDDNGLTDPLFVPAGTTVTIPIS